MLRPLTLKRAAPLYARARLAAGALSTDRKSGRTQEQQGTDVAALEQTRATIEAVAKMAATLQDGIRKRAVTHGPRPHPAPTTPSPSHTLPPGVQPAPGRSSGGVA
ncbi:hypothetical protein ACIQNG_33640 [Streptomyces sp. NPDC091377]|uniref:hypothetical protein n=1 Tax=Streptomyces sp. NPDC091377 TaxID=3365995 RepID=UPI00380EC6FC